MKPSISLLLLLLLPACGTGASGEETGDANVPLWHLSDEPAVTIGVADGDPRYQLYRAADATVLGNGSIVVVNAGNASLALYDRSGKFLTTTGRKGQGPGEFEAPVWVGATPQDSILVWDQRLKRLSVFAPTGEPARFITPADPEGTFPTLVGVLGDGSFVLAPGPDMLAMLRAPRGVWRDSATLSRYGREGERLGTLGPFPQDEQYLIDRPTGFAWHDLPFGRRTLTVASPHGLYVGDSGSGEISVFSPDGTRSRLLHSPHTRWELTKDDVARYREERLAPLTDEARRQEMEQTLAEAPFPEVAPAFGDLAVDPDGNVWVQAYPRPGAASVTWIVLTPDGRPAGQISVPRDLKVYEVGRDYVLGLRLDELDVEQLHLYTVAKS